MGKRGNNQRGFSAILIVLIILILTALLVGGGIYYWQRRASEEAKEEFGRELARPEISPPLFSPTPAPTSTVVSTPTPMADPYAGWLTYTNEVYDYAFRYPRGAIITEAEQEAFSLTPDEVRRGVTFEEKYREHTGKICVSISYRLGYVQISAPVNRDFTHVICGRTGRAYEGPDRTEELTIDGRTYTASGFEEQGPGETLNYHNETLVVTLDDETRIEYGSRPDETATFADYLAMREEIVRIVESYWRITHY